MAAFFEQMKLEFKDKSQIEKTFNGYSQDEILESKINDWTYDEYMIKQIPEKEKNIIERYGETVMQAYIRNGLSSEEVKLRQEGGLNKLPDKKKTPGYIKFLLEISNVFSLLLWFGAILSLIGYFLAPSDMSNVFISLIFSYG
jgi:magnesium-transporting ATPase (P-type)